VNQVVSAVANACGRVEQELPDISWDAQAALYGELLQMITTVFSPDGGSKPTLAQYLTALDKRDKLIAEWERFFEPAPEFLGDPMTHPSSE
jgi:hypothetical protein